MIEALQKGDEVVTAGGILGKISKIERPVRDDRDRAERRDQVQRGAIAQLLPKGTIKSCN